MAFTVFQRGGGVQSACRIPQSPLESASSGVYSLPLCVCVLCVVWVVSVVWVVYMLSGAGKTGQEERGRGRREEGRGKKRKEEEGRKEEGREA